MMSKKLVIWDFDGTLVDSEFIAAQVFPRVWSTMGLHMTPDYFISHFVGTASSADIYNETIAKLPRDGMKIANEVFEKELSENLQAISGVSDLLAKISVEKCVASNSSLPYLIKALEKTSLNIFFGDHIYSAFEVAYPKPAADVFLYACRDLGFQPSECLVIEDSIAGITAAKNAGMTVIGSMAGKHCTPVVKERILAAQADHYCQTMEDLEKILARCL